MEELYTKYAIKLYKYIYALCCNHDITEDILQETFYSAIKNIEHFKNNSSIYTWLCTIAKNKWNDYLRKNRKIQFTSLENDINSNISIELEVETKEQIGRLYQIISKLDETTQEVIKLRIISEFNFKEIGEMFGKSEQWAKNVFYRGRLKIKEKFKNG